MSNKKLNLFKRRRLRNRNKIKSADNKVIFLESSIICAEIFLEDLKILNLNLSGFETFLSLFVILNFFLVLVLNFIIFSYPLFSKHIDLFL